MTPKKIAITVGAAALLLLTSLIVWDVLVVTDEEIVEKFAYAITREVNTKNIDNALVYVDIDVQPVLIEVRGQSFRHEEDQESFSAMAHSHLRPFEGVKQHVLRKDVQVRGMSASVAVESFTRRGQVAVDWELRKRGDRWLVNRMSIR
jgi:hypothetical protein